MLLAASTGIVGATVVAMGMIALPTMLRSGYDPQGWRRAWYVHRARLGQIIPPSTLLIILSDVVSNSYQQAQYEQGKFAIDTISVGQIFAAALLPGLTMVVLYILYILLPVAGCAPKTCLFWPRMPDPGLPLVEDAFGHSCLPFF